MDDKHTHDWNSYDKKMLICHSCRTVISLADLLERTENRAAKQKEINVLSKLLFAGAFKKDAHDQIYARVRSMNPEFDTAQETLL